MTPLRPGDELPDIPLTDTAGLTTSLADLSGEETLIIFQRHLACLPCREHLLEVLARKDELGLRVVVVAFAPADALAGYRRRLGLDDALVLSDLERRTYRAFGFGRGSLARVWLAPRVWWRYLTLIRRGRRPERVQQDTLQLGGDVLIDAYGRVRWVYASRGPEDRPSLAAIRAARDITPG
jgi:peroxiredoxin